MSSMRTIDDYQKLFNTIYCVHNDRIYETPDLIIMLARSATYLLKGVRKGKLERIQPGLAESFGWTMAIANREHISLGMKILHYFPHVCPYCAKAPCDSNSHNRAAGRKDLDSFRKDLVVESLNANQTMLAAIYPENVLVDSAQHLVEEVVEVSIADFINRRMHSLPELDQNIFEHIVLELVDVVGHLCAIANCVELNLSEIVDNTFGIGCPGCKKPVCECSFSYIAEYR